MIQYDATMLWHKITWIGIANIRYKSQYAKQDGSKKPQHCEMFQADSVRDAAFGCDWVGTPIPFQRCLMFIIATANKGFQLTAGKFVAVSNLTMMNVGRINILHYFFKGLPALVALASLCWGFSITLSHAILIRYLWMSEKPNSGTSTW
jgi:hypothetical protein